jgi:hypothetical protein
MSSPQESPDTRPWFQRGYRHSTVDMHIPDWDPKLLSKYDPAAMVKLFKKAGSTSVLFFTQAHTGLCYWPTKTGKMHAGLRGRDIVGEMLGLLRKAKIDACAYYSVIYNNWAFLEHPDWRMVAANAQPGAVDEGKFAGGRYGTCCPNQPGYHAFALAQSAELLAAYAFDGLFYDMTFWPTVCVCDRCQARHKAETGAEIPRTIDWFSPDWCRFQDARERWMIEFASELSAHAKRLRPGITVCHNFATALFNWTLGLSFRSSAANDFLSVDVYGDLPQQAMTSKLLVGLSKYQPVEFLTSRCCNLGDHEENKSFDEMRLTALTSTLFGAAMGFIDAINPDGSANPKPYAMIRDINRELAAYEPFLGGTPVEDVAIYYSSESKMDFVENGQPLAEAALWELNYPHKKSIRGVCRVLQRAHIPFGIITRTQLPDLDRYKVVVLPNVLRMDPEEVAAFREYVRRGGRIYASRYTSLTETKGIRHADFMLADVFGCHFAADDLGQVSYVKPHPGRLLQAIAPQTCLSFLGTKDKPGHGVGTLRLADRAEGHVLATLTLPYDKEWGTVFQQNWTSIHSSPPWRDTPTPTLVSNRFGKGRAVYCAADLEVVECPANSRLLLHLLRDLLGNRQSASAETPPAVWMTVNDQPNHGRVVAGFLNHPPLLPPVPIAEIPFTLRPPAGKHFARLRTAPDGKPLKFTTGRGGTIRATLKDLEALKLVAAEYR